MLLGASSPVAAPFQRTATHRPALNPALHPKLGNRSRTPSPDPFAYLRESAVPHLGFSGSTEDVRDNVTANIGEPKIPSGIAIGEFLVIESE